MIQVAVLAGGCSPEHEISLQSGSQVLAHLDLTRWRPYAVRLARDGSWWVDPVPWCTGTPDAAAPVSETFQRATMQRLRPPAAVDFLLAELGVEVVLPILHGPFGEDGTVQGMLELCGVPFVGSGCAASAVAMDKIRTRECLEFRCIPMPKAYVPSCSLAAADPSQEAERIAETVGFPCFLKADLSGSSLGVVPAQGAEDVAAFLGEFRGRRRRFMAEARIEGEEITVAVLGNSGGELEALPPVGIYPLSETYFNYQAKYDPQATEELVPPRGLSAAEILRVQELGRRCHVALQCDGLSRTDMIVGPDGPLVLELNTLPGLTEVSLLPKAAAAHGLGYAALLDRLLELALALARGREQEQEVS